MRPRAAGAIAVAACASICALPVSASATFPGANGKIAFTSTRDGHSEIYVMDPDGANQKRLTTSTSSLDPAWSPDGSKIAYTGTGGIHVMDADGTDDRTPGTATR